MIKYSTRADDEVQEWRAKVYEATKGMTLEEVDEYIERDTMPIIRQFHLRVMQPDGTVIQY
jgi:hypothetical protein